MIINSQKFNWKRYIKKHLPIIAAFMIPGLVLLVLYIFNGVYPFGTNMYLRSDMYHQYAPFLKEFQRNIQNGGSLLYAWNIGLGTNFVSTYAYYLASPANWIVFLLPDTVIPEFMSAMIMIKSGLMSAFFAWYLIKKFKYNDFRATAFGCFYAMSAYMAAFSWNVMWLDCLVLLPLILMGVEALVKEGKTRMYTITLALAIISNYYIAIMICIFLVLYFIYLMICEGTAKKASDVIYRICQFAFHSLIAGMIAAVIILPAFYTLFITASAESSFPKKLTAYYNILELFTKGTMTMDTAVFSGHFPNIFSSMCLWMMIPLYCINMKFKLKERIGKVILVGIFFFSFMFNIPTYIWHGFHFPNSLPCRQSFICIFILLTMGYQAFANIRKFTNREICITAGCGILGLFALQALYDSEGDFTLPKASLSAGFLILYLVIAALYKQGKIKLWKIGILLLVLCVGECGINSAVTGYSTTSRTYYMSDNEAIKTLTESIDDDSFYRVEKVVRRTKNDGTWNNYNSASVFSSTTVAGNSDFYDNMGVQGQTNSFSIYGHTPLMQAILGVKYELATTEQNDPLMTEINSTEDMILYQNKYSLSLGFLVDGEFLEEFEILNDKPFTNQERLAGAMLGENEIANLYNEQSSVSGSTCEFTFKKTGRGLVFISTKVDAVKVTITRDGEEILSKKYSSLENPEIIDLFDVEAGDQVTITSADEDVSKLTVYPAVMDYDVYDEVMGRLSADDRQMEMLEFEDTYVKGTVSCDEDCLLFTTIPYDEGWTVYVDGVETKYENFEDSFIALYLTSGEHTIEFKYWPQGLTAGAVISVTALAVFILSDIFFTRKRKKHKPDNDNPENSDIPTEIG